MASNRRSDWSKAWGDPYDCTTGNVNYPLDGRDTLDPAYDAIRSTKTVGHYRAAYEEAMNPDGPPSDMPDDFWRYLLQRVPTTYGLDALPPETPISPTGVIANYAELLADDDEREEPETEKMLTLGDIFAPLTVADLLKNTQDANGADHGADGKFTSGAAAGRKSEGAKAHAVFTLGGPGSGKGSLAAAYAKKYGIDKVIDADHIKKSIPGYSDKFGVNGFGPSGARNQKHLDEYPKETRDALEATIKSHGFAGFEDFSKHLLGNGKTFGGGITHELSRHISLKLLNNALNSGESFVYDSVGGARNHPKYAERARAAGMHVHIAHAKVPREVALMHNDDRPRTIPIDLALTSHGNADHAAGVLKAEAEKHPENTDFTTYHMSTPADLKAAKARGYTPRGKTGATDEDALAEAKGEGYGRYIHAKVHKAVDGARLGS
jgi:hypothetical protein